MAINMKMAVFWILAPCGLVDVYRLIALMMEIACTFETLASIYQITYTTAQKKVIFM